MTDEQTMNDMLDDLFDEDGDLTTRVDEPDDPGLPRIGNGGSVHGSDILERRARDYAKQVVADTGIAVDMTKITWRMSRRMTKGRGLCRYNGGDECEIVLSRHEYDNHGWGSVKETIRHELIHVAQKHNDEIPGHGASFRKRMEMMDVEKTGADSPAREARYEIYCPSCDAVVAKRQVRSKTVKKPHLYRCRACGGELKSRVAR